MVVEPSIKEGLKAFQVAKVVAGDRVLPPRLKKRERC
jgi:hypothetical protein